MFRPPSPALRRISPTGKLTLLSVELLLEDVEPPSNPEANRSPADSLDDTLYPTLGALCDWLEPDWLIWDGSGNMLAWLAPAIERS